MQTCITIGIGVNKYDDPGWEDLSNCEFDVSRVMEVLMGEYGIEEPELLFKPEQTSGSAIYNRLHERLMNCSSQDSVLIFFAGHGQHNERLGTTYWIPSDGKAMDPSTWLDLDTIVRLMRASHALHISVVSDTCFSGGIFSPSTRGGGIEAFAAKKSRMALASGSMEYVSDGKENEGSPFANALIAVLKDNEAKEMTFLELSNRTIMHLACVITRRRRWKC